MNKPDSMLRKYGKFFEAGTVLFEEGDTGDNMFVIQSGKVKISRRVGSQEALLAVLPAGEFFGEMSIINNSPRSATATALEDSHLLVLDAQTFEALIRGNTEIAVRMIKRLAERLDHADRQIELLLRRDPNHRVVQFLREEAQKLGMPSPAGTAVPITEGELAMRVGLSKEEVQKVIGRLETARLVTRDENGLFVIPEVGKLQEFLDFLEMTERFGNQ